MKSKRENAFLIKYVVIVSVCFFSAVHVMAQDPQCILSLNTSELDGTNGFLINGIDPADQSGRTVANAGDINDDGIDDIIIGAYWADPDGNDKFGEVYILFGTTSVRPSSLDLSSLNGTNGFKIDGIDSWTGRKVSPAGDVNGDGIDDIIFAAIYTDLDGGSSFENTGSAYVIYGSSAGFTSSFDLNSLNGTNGFVINGVDPGDLTGISLSNAGDINNDTIDDIIIGAQYAWPNGIEDAGRSYVVFGQASGFPAVFELSDLDGVNGFTINGINVGDESASAVNNAGDINADGIDDIIVSSRLADPNGSSSGQVYVIFGSNTGFSSQINLSSLDGSNGFIIDGESSGDTLGGATNGIGDINNDGIDDIAIGARGADATYVIFGSGIPFSARFDLTTLDGVNGFVIEELDPVSVDSAGDFNNDGISDLIIGVAFGTFSRRGGYVIFGKSEPWQQRVEIDDISSFRIIEDGLQENLGYDVDGTGDFNGDGITDIIIGAPAIFERDEVNGLSGVSYVIYGNDNIGDTQRPDITCPGNQELASGSVIPDYVSLISVSDNCDNDPVILQNPVAGTAFSDGMTITFTVTDEAGNSNDCSFIIDAIIDIDTEAPEITCPSNQELPCNTNVIPNYTGLVSVTDNLDPNPIVIQDPIEGSSFINGMIITFMATDAAGNSNSCSIQLNESTDSEAPTFSCLPDQSLSCGSILPDYTVMITAMDNCDGSPSITQNPIAGTDFVDGMTVEITVSDASGNSDSCQFVVNESTDTEAPTFSCLPDQSLSCGSILPDYTAMITATDNCDTSPSITQNPIAGTDFVDGMTVEITVSDASGNSDSCQFVVNESADTEAPTFSCLPDQSLSCGSILPDYTVMITVTDNCDASPSITQNPIAGTDFVDGMTVEITVSDTSGNSDSCQFVVNESTDSEAPTFSCLPDQSLSCGSILPDYTVMITATDNCDASPSITQNPIAGTDFVDGMTVEITVSDTLGNSDSCQFVVNESTDSEAPTFSCLPDQSLSCGSILPDYTVMITATDNCDASPSITQNPIAGTDFVDGMTVEITVSDASGNSDSCQFVVNESTDTEAPTFSCLPDQSLSCGSILPDYTAMITATDNCDTSPSITQNPIAGTDFVDGMTVEITVSDASGNSDSCQFVVNESADTEAPTFSCLPDQSLSCGSILPDYTVMITATDNCDASPSITQNPIAGTDFVDGMTVEITVSDASGNSDSCQFVVNESPDSEAPTFSCLPDQSLSCGSILPDYTAMITATDNCDGSPSITQNPIAGTDFVDGMTVEITVSDSSGNSDSCQFVVNELADSEVPMITCPGNQILTIGSLIPDYSNTVTVVDNCDTNVSVEQIPSAGTTFVDGMTIQFIATDSSGNSNSCSFVITASSDIEAPVIVCLSDQVLSCSTQIISDYRSEITVIDDMDPNPMITQLPAPGTEFIDGMEVTITATDASGNSSECSFRLDIDATSIDAGDDEEITEGEEVQLNIETSDSGTIVWFPTIGLTDSTISNPVASPTETITYTVTFTSDEGCIAEDMITVFVEQLPEDETKYGFSPDGDGINEFWEIDGIENYPNNKVSIYNRWGDLVFEIDGYNNTSRVFNGIANRKRSLGADKLPEGTYFFGIKTQGSNNFRKSTGFLVLKR